MMMPANNGVPVTDASTPSFAPAFEPRDMQSAHGYRFGPAGPWQPQVNGVLSSSVPVAQLNARAPPLLSTATPLVPQQYSRPPAAPSSLDAGLQNAHPTPVPGSLPPAIRASPAQVLSVLFIIAV